MKKISMVMTSRNRRDEIKRYITSLNNQKDDLFPFLQLIFVDQGDNRELFNELKANIEFKYVKNVPCSLSAARNLGLEYADGDYVCFPDDDCWYDEDTLYSVISFLRENDEIDGLAIIAKDENDVNISDFPDEEKWLTYTNHFCALSISIFLKYDSVIRFDENIGVGSKYNLSSGEETDYLLTYMERHPGFRIKYLPTIVIRHPNAKFEGFNNSIEKTYGYARGNGYIIRKHNFTLMYKLMALMKPIVWIVVRAFTDRSRVRQTIAYTKGRFEGFFFRIKQ